MKTLKTLGVGEVDRRNITIRKWFSDGESGRPHWVFLDLHPHDILELLRDLGNAYRKVCTAPEGRPLRILLGWCHLDVTKKDTSAKCMPKYSADPYEILEKLKRDAGDCEERNEILKRAIRDLDRRTRVSFEELNKPIGSMLLHENLTSREEEKEGEKITMCICPAS